MGDKLFESPLFDLICFCLLFKKHVSLHYKSHVVKVTQSRHTYLALFWQTAAVDAVVASRHQKSSPPLLHTTTRATEHTYTRDHEGGVKARPRTGRCLQPTTYPAGAAVLCFVLPMRLHHPVHHLLLLSGQTGRRSLRETEVNNKFKYRFTRVPTMRWKVHF